MKKLISIPLSLMLFASVSFAELNQQQVDTYLKVSGAQEMLNNLQQQIGGMVEQQAKQTGEKIDPLALVAIQDVMTRDENFAKFTNHVKNLDEKAYAALIAYYKTDLGKKVANIAAHTDLETMEKELPLFMAEIQKAPPSQQRMSLVKELNAAINTSELQEKMMVEMFDAINSIMPKEKQMPTEQIAGMLQGMKPIIEQQTQISTLFSYKSLSDKELQEVITHAKSSGGQAEVEAILNGTIDYMSVVMHQMFKELFAQAPK